MNEKAVERLAIVPGADLNPDPLIEWHFRFSRRGNRWTRVSFYSKGSFRRGLPRVVSRVTVAQEVGVPEEAIAAWQAAFMASERSEDDATAESKLSVGSDAPIDTNPLAGWHFEFFPQSGVWRRTRGQRAEVSRGAVAKKVGVSEDMIEQWEDARIALWQSESKAVDREASE